MDTLSAITTSSSDQTTPVMILDALIICSRCHRFKYRSEYISKITGQYCKTCNSCRNGGKCEHNQQKSRCKACHGGSICEHNKHRSRCIECHGGEICKHNKRRSRCKECHGSEICEHNRRKSRCKECSNSSTKIAK